MNREVKEADETMPQEMVIIHAKARLSLPFHHPSLGIFTGRLLFHPIYILGHRSPRRPLWTNRQNSLFTSLSAQEVTGHKMVLYIDSC